MSCFFVYYSFSNCCIQGCRQNSDSNSSTPLLLIRDMDKPEGCSASSKEECEICIWSCCWVWPGVALRQFSDPRSLRVMTEVRRDLCYNIYGYSQTWVTDSSCFTVKIWAVCMYSGQAGEVTVWQCVLLSVYVCMRAPSLESWYSSNTDDPRWAHSNAGLNHGLIFDVQQTNLEGTKNGARKFQIKRWVKMWIRMGAI